SCPGACARWAGCRRRSAPAGSLAAAGGTTLGGPARQPPTISASGTRAPGPDGARALAQLHGVRHSRLELRRGVRTVVEIRADAAVAQDVGRHVLGELERPGVDELPKPEGAVRAGDLPRGGRGTSRPRPLRIHPDALARPARDSGAVRAALD